jgi:hypothetical protein
MIHRRVATTWIRPVFASATRRWLLLSMLGAAISGPAAEKVAAEELEKSGTVRIEQVQIAFIGSGNLGGGKLQFAGRTYDFTIGGLSSGNGQRSTLAS